MAKQPPKHSQFKKGQSGNPSGRPKLPADVQKAKQLTAIEFTRLVNKYLMMSREEIQQSLQRPDVPMLELIVGGMVAKAAKDHDHQRANFILDRTIGKVKEPDKTLNFNFNAMSRSEIIAHGVEAIKYLEGQDENK